jgi:2-dehydropantoate 2-reductase
MAKKIAILGAGANGASIGADLTNAGLDVVLIEQWPEHVQTMRSEGLRINMPDETLQLPVRAFQLCDVATFTEKFDVVLVLMKAYDTRWACQLIEPHLKPDALVVGVQNGMTTDVVADVVGSHRTMGAVIEISSMMFEPGIVERHSPPPRSWFAVGSIDAATAGRESEITELLSLAGTAEVVEDIRASKWMKLVSNASTLVITAILDLPILAAAAEPAIRELMLRASQEALDAGEALGYPLLPIFGLTADEMGSAESVVELLLDTLCAGFVLPHTTTTVVHDWTKGRHSEVDDVNGLVVAELARYGSPAPVNAAIVEVAHRIERGDLKPGRANLYLLRQMIGFPEATDED